MIRILALVISAIFFFGCQSAIKVNNRSPLLPVFPEIESDEFSKTNPYFQAVTQFFDTQTITLSDGTEYKVEPPYLTSPIGTFYRFPFHLYVYGMTDGAGLQWDFWHWGSGKMAVSGLGGFHGNFGGQILASQQVGHWGELPIVPYIAVQRRVSRTLIQCAPTQSDFCVEGSTRGRNTVRILEDTWNPLIGVQLGRFLVKDNSNTTVYFKLEAGLNTVVSKKVIFEAFPSNYTHTNGSFINLETGFTIW